MAAKKAAIAAAIERAKAQKAAAAPQNVVDAIPSVQAEIAEIDARREAAKQSVTDAIATNDAQEEK
jgi:electron transport complex protein RnfC